MEWTDEIISRLQTLWQEGLSTAEIGRQLNITKNAVVGKAHRLGLPPRPSPIRTPAKPRKDTKADVPKAETVEASPVVEAVSAVQEPVMPAENSAAPVSVPEARKATVAEKAAEVTPVAETVAPKAINAKPEKPKADTVKAAPQDAPRSAEPRKVAPEVTLRPLLRPLAADPSPRRGPSCCWPIGDPGMPGFHFCGAHPVPGKPYCAEHCAVAYVKLRDRRESVG